MKRRFMQLSLVVASIVMLIMLTSCTSKDNKTADDFIIPKDSLQEESKTEIIKMYKDKVNSGPVFLRDEYDSDNAAYIMFYRINVTACTYELDYQKAWITWLSKLIKVKATYESGDTWNLAINVEETNEIPNEGIIGTRFTNKDMSFSAEILSIDTSNKTILMNVDSEYMGEDGSRLSLHGTGSYSYSFDQQSFGWQQYNEIIIDLVIYNETLYYLRTQWHPSNKDHPNEESYASLIGTANGTIRSGTAVDWDLTYNKLIKK